MKLTRREMVVAAAGSAVAVQALAQAPVAAGARDFGKEARDSVQKNGDALTKFEIAMAVEPAFQFKP